MAIPLLAVGAAVAVAGAVSQAQAQKQSANYNAGVASSNAVAQKQISDYNSTVANQNADQAVDQAEMVAANTRVMGNRLGGQQTAYLGKYGLVGGSGDNIKMDSAINNELQAMTESYKGKVAATGFRQQSALDTYQGTLSLQAGQNQSNLFQMQADNAQTQGFFGAAGALLGGASKGVAVNNLENPTSESNSVPIWQNEEDEFPTLVS